MISHENSRGCYISKTSIDVSSVFNTLTFWFGLRHATVGTCKQVLSQGRIFHFDLLLFLFLALFFLFLFSQFKSFICRALSTKPFSLVHKLIKLASIFIFLVIFFFKFSRSCLIPLNIKSLILLIIVSWCVFHHTIY
jgi:hypothetical protein